MRFRYILYKLLYSCCQLNKQHYINILHFISTSVYVIIYIYRNISNIIMNMKLELR